MKKYSKFGESRKEKALTNDNFFNNHLPELYITQQQNLCLLILRECLKKKGREL